MKLSLNWLKDYVNPKLSPEKLAERLTMAGLEVEEVRHTGNDTVLDLEITPNRPDCLSIIGLAREVAGITANSLKLPKIKSYALKKSAAFRVTVENTKDCPRYIGTLIKNVHVAAAPDGLASRLSTVGIKSINNAVDITNFVLLETGQPLHAFDYDKLAGGAIIVRRARAGEKIIAIDGSAHRLDPSILVLADAQKPVAIAGIMGGKESEITAQTKNIVLESAQFDMGLVRRASRTLGLKSDSSYRFERGVDYEGVLTGANRATDLLLEHLKGVLSDRIDVRSTQIKTKMIAIFPTEIEALLGTAVSAAQAKNMLSRLGLKVKTGAQGKLQVGIPDFRVDLNQPADLIEEIARMIGYDRLPLSLPTIAVANISVIARPREVKKTITEVLFAQGFSEAITYALINQNDLNRSHLGHLPKLPLESSLSQEHNILRPSLLPSLLKVAAGNFNHGQKDLKIFEIGKRYLPDGRGAAEHPTLGILITGKRNHDWRTSNKETLNFFDLKGALENIVQALQAPLQVALHPYPAFAPAESVSLLLHGKSIGTAGRIDAQVLTQWGIKAKEVYFAGVHLEELFVLPKPVLKYQPVSEFPAIQRDVSLAVKQEISYRALSSRCMEMGGDILQEMHLIEEYTGDKIPQGTRGLVFALIYQSLKRTLREEEVNAVHQKLLNALTHEFGATVR